MNALEKAIYKMAFGNPNLDSSDEQKHNLDILRFAIGLKNPDTLAALYNKGPLHDGDVPDKTDRDLLISQNYAAHTIKDGQWGYNVCTYRGAWLYKCVRAIDEILAS